jgi:N-acetylmuramoyl-L-alanine amidase
MIAGVIDRLSPNTDTRGGRAIDLVILHYTGMRDAETALARLCDPAPVAGAYPGPWQDPAIDPNEKLARVSAHYVVGEAGQVWRVAPESERAWHAGLSHWEGEQNCNARAIGVEIVNGGHDFGLPPYPAPQIASVIALVKDILARHALTPARVVGHSDVAPLRKEDPGEHFPWKRLADAGCALWPEGVSNPVPDSDADVRAALTRFGYDPSVALDAVVRAFQRRFRPARIDGVADVETRTLLGALTR